eukprot:SAG31_NODE_877_length_11303_cov_18.744556_9_plen_890_part_00
MNFVAHEFDIIRPKDPKKPCISSTSDHPVPCERSSVPSYEQYNHHYSNTVMGKGKRLVQTGIPSTDTMATHTGHIEGYELVVDEDEAPANPQAPASQFLPMGNGAESRLTVKYFPVGFGALLESPTQTSINPMIIDTNARGDHSAVAGTPQIPGRHGPVAKASNVGPEEMYSGLMECPCTDAFPKTVANAMTKSEGTCDGTSAMASADKCFAEAASLGLQAKTNVTVHTSSNPPGCFATAVSGGYEIAFNLNAKSPTACGASGDLQRRVAMEQFAMHGECDSCRLDVDMQSGSMPPSADIVGEWQIAGPYDAGALITITMDSNTNFTMMCNGNCGGKNGVFGTGPVTPDGNTYWGFSIPGAISADRNQIKWSNGVIFNRWFPETRNSVNITGTFMLFGLGEMNSANNAWIGKQWTIAGDNEHFIIRGPAVAAAGQRGSVTNGNTLTAFPNVPGTISPDFNSVNFTNGVFLKRIDQASLDNGNITITMSGPADKWFGAGFMDKLPVTTPGSHSGSAMDGTWAVIVLGNGQVEERKLGHHEAGTVLAPSVRVVSNSVVDGVRHVTLSRPFGGVTLDHYSFKKGAAHVGMISAVGSSGTFGYHAAHATSKLYFVDVGAPTCICDAAPPLGSTASQGTIGSVSFRSNCGKPPLGQMLADIHWANKTLDPKYGKYTDNNGVNPTCQLSAYRGGLKCCAGGTIITDGEENRAKLLADANYDHYQVMYRYYYTDATNGLENNGSPIVDTYWTFWWTEFNNGEHDVPPCYASPCVYPLTSNFTGANLPGAKAGVDTLLIHVEGHCHIGCLGMELYNVDDPLHPQLLCQTKIDYGQSDKPQDEMGYILGNQPCIFGVGFQEPPVIKTTTKLMSIKYQNNTHPRYGDMALWELRAAYKN